MSHVHTFYIAAVKQKQATERDRHIPDARAERNIDNLCEHPYETGMQSLTVYAQNSTVSR